MDDAYARFARALTDFLGALPDDGEPVAILAATEISSQPGGGEVHTTTLSTTALNELTHALTLVRPARNRRTVA